MAKRSASYSNYRSTAFRYGLSRPRSACRGVRPSKCGNLLIEPELLPAFGRSRRAALGSALADGPGEVRRRVDPPLRGNYRVRADFAQYVEEAGEPLLGVHLEGDLAVADLQHTPDPALSTFGRPDMLVALGTATRTVLRIKG